MQVAPTQALTVTLSAAASMSGLSRSTLYRRADEGLLKMVSVSGRRLVVVASLKKFLGIEDETGVAA